MMKNNQSQEIFLTCEQMVTLLCGDDTGVPVRTAIMTAKTNDGKTVKITIPNSLGKLTVNATIE